MIDPQRVYDVMTSYEDDPEACHIEEDKLLWEYVEARAAEGDAEAQALMKFTTWPDRVRWYA